MDCVFEEVVIDVVDNESDVLVLLEDELLVVEVLDRVLLVAVRAVVVEFVLVVEHLDVVLLTDVRVAVVEVVVHLSTSSAVIGPMGS